MSLFPSPAQHGAPAAGEAKVWCGMVLCLAEGDSCEWPGEEFLYFGVDLPDGEEDEAGEEKAHLCDLGNDLELLVCKVAFTAAQAMLGV